MREKAEQPSSGKQYLIWYPKEEPYWEKASNVDVEILTAKIAELQESNQS